MSHKLALLVKNEEHLSNMVVLSIIISLFISSNNGVILLGCMVASCIFSRKILIRKKYERIVLANLLCYVVYILNTPGIFGNASAYFSHVTLMLFFVLIFSLEYTVRPTKNQSNLYHIDLIDLLYFFLFSGYVLLLIIYWKESDYYVLDERMHQVDFSFYTFLVSMIGLKRKWFISSLALIFASIIILPSRALKVMYLVFFVCMVFKKKIFFVLEKFKINNSYKMMVVLVVFSVVFSFLWVTALHDIIGVKSHHEGLLDTSSFGHAQSILNGLDIILSSHNIFGGIGHQVKNALSEKVMAYGNIYPHFSYFSILIDESILYGLVYLYSISKILDEYWDVDNILYVLPYLVGACTLFDLFIGARFALFLAMLRVPERSRALSVRGSLKVVIRV